MELRVPLGVDDSGRPIELDLRMAALGGMGPHGLLVGAPGSGKSELLRTLLDGLAATHSPDELNVLLVDFRDGAAFAGLDELPHTSAVVTGLSAEPALADRLTDALGGELARRQALLHRGGPYTSRHDYAEAWAEGAPLDPLPSLLVVVDEFSELLGSKPDFINLLVQLGRVGRGLGVHLLLATHLLEAGRLRGLDGYLSYRIALRTSSAAESRAVIGVPDAYELPHRPGIGFVRTGTEVLERFQATPGTRSERPRRQGTPAHRIWLPPLDEPPALEALLAWAARGTLRVPVGIVDKPFEHRRDPLWLDLAGDQGNVAIVGGPGSGRSTLLRTLVTSLELTHTSNEVGFYPPPATPELTALLEHREVEFAADGIDSIATYRQLRREGRIEPGGFPADVFLVADGWDAVEPAVSTLVARGLGYGVHVVTTSVQAAEEFPTVLRLGDHPGHGLTADNLHFLAAIPADLRQ